jgi:hypothetical protein
MCEPTTIALVASMAIAAVSGYVAYDSSKKSQRYQEQVADQNKKVAEAQAVDAERLGQIEASERRLKTRMQIASQQVGFGAQNVEQTGTALDILGDTAMFGEIDEGRIRANTARKAWGFRMQGYDIESNKRLMQFNEKNSRTGTILSTAGSMLGAYGSYGGAGGMGKMTPSSAAPLSQNTSFSPASFNLAPTSYNVRIGG